MSFLLNEWILIPLVGICVFTIFFNYIDKWIEFLKKRSLGQRAEIIRYLKLMRSEPEEKKVTIQLLLLSFGLGTIFFFLFWPKFILGIAIAIPITIAGWTIPKIAIMAMYQSRCGRFVDQMVDALTIMANGIKAGSNPQESMRRVIEIMGDPVASEFQQVLNQMQVGDSFENALNDLGNRIPRPDVQMFVTAINILKETGGNLSETFQTIVSTIRERQKVEKKIEALTAQGLMQGFIVTMIPFLLAIVFLVVDPSFIMPMFNSTLGIILLMVMIALQITGGIIIKKIVTIKV